MPPLFTSGISLSRGRKGVGVWRVGVAAWTERGVGVVMGVVKGVVMGVRGGVASRMRAAANSLP